MYEIPKGLVNYLSVKKTGIIELGKIEEVIKENFSLKRYQSDRVVVAHALNLSTWEIETGISQ